jgi:hypothetical protein
LAITEKKVPDSPWLPIKSLQKILITTQFPVLIKSVPVCKIIKIIFSEFQRPEVQKSVRAMLPLDSRGESFFFQLLLAVLGLWLHRSDFSICFHVVISSVSRSYLLSLVRTTCWIQDPPGYGLLSSSFIITTKTLFSNKVT